MADLSHDTEPLSIDTLLSCNPISQTFRLHWQACVPVL